MGGFAGIPKMCSDDGRYSDSNTLASFSKTFIGFVKTSYKHSELVAVPSGSKILKKFKILSYKCWSTRA